MISQKIKVALLDDHTLFRKTITNYLHQQGNIEIVAQAPNLDDLFSTLEQNEPDILLCEFCTPSVNGFEVKKIAQLKRPRTKIIFLSMCRDISIISSLLEEGIYGYVSKTDEPEELVQAIKTVHSNNRIFRNKWFTEALYWGTEHTVTKPEQDKAVFDEREQRIIQLLWREKSNREIAEELFLSTRSIEKIRQHMKSKLGVKTTLGVIKYAINNRIIEMA